MLKKMIILLIVTSTLFTVTTVAFDKRGRLSALNEFDVKKNKSVLLRTNRCKSCYLAYAKLSGMDLAYAQRKRRKRKMAMKPNQFYSVVLRKKIMILADKVREVVRKGRRFAVGKYVANGKNYEAWKILGMAKLIF